MTQIVEKSCETILKFHNCIAFFTSKKKNIAQFFFYPFILDLDLLSAELKRAYFTSYKLLKKKFPMADGCDKKQLLNLVVPV